MPKRQEKTIYEQLEALEGRLEVLLRVPKNKTKRDMPCHLYLMWSKFTLAQQVKLRELWKQYFKDCRTTNTYLLYQEIKEDLKFGRKGLAEDKIQLIKKQANEDNKLYSKPKFVDPEWLLAHQDVQEYINLTNRKQYLKKEMEYLNQPIKISV